MTVDELIDALDGKRSYIPCIYVLNKIDAISMEELEILNKMPHFVPVSGHLEWNFEELYETIWDYLDFIRIYTKPKDVIVYENLLQNLFVTMRKIDLYSFK